MQKVQSSKGETVSRKTRLETYLLISRRADWNMIEKKNKKRKKIYVQ
jgi:hypothetical protein